MSGAIDKVHEDSSALVLQIIDEKDPAKVEELTQLFDLNMKKKRIARMNKLSVLLDAIDTEVASRLYASPESFDNDQLAKYMNVTQQALSTNAQEVQQMPTIQINTQNNIGTDQTLSSQSRKRVYDTVMAILKESGVNDEEGSEELSSDSAKTNEPTEQSAKGSR